MDLSPGQQAALDAIEVWYTETDQQVFRMFGPAGTGKTTIARLVPEMLGIQGACYFGAFSGKAANVLRSKGCLPANTLHSLVYGAPIDRKQEQRKIERHVEELQALEGELLAIRVRWVAPAEEGGEKPTPEEARAGLIAGLRDQWKMLDRQIRSDGRYYWPPVVDGVLQEASLLIADEVSMVSDRMAGDILATGVRVLVLGDPEQLPPINGEGFFTRERPDIMLHEIHRQALDSPVLSLATAVREGARLGSKDYTHGGQVDYTSFDQILCWRRKTRWGAVRHVRNLLGREAGVPVVGDRVMNLQNNKDLGLFNGQMFVVSAVEPGRWPTELSLTVYEEGDDPEKTFDVYVYTAGFTEEGEAEAEKARIGWRGDTALFTFAHALTVHKAQGSEWKKVCIIDETRPMWGMENKKGGEAHAVNMTRRWLYTAITRAADQVTIVEKP